MVPADTFGSTLTFRNADFGALQPVVTVYVIFVVPAETAVTSPDVAFTVATAGFVLLQVPPGSPLDVKVGAWPIQSGVNPLTIPAFAFGLTVTTVEADCGALQPVLTV
jgi:hypothetical protein